MKTNVLATLTIASFLVTGCVNLEALRKITEPVQVEEQPVPTSDSVKQICEEYLNNQARADDKYKGKLLTVTGKVKYISEKQTEVFNEEKDYTELYFKDVTEADLTHRTYITAGIGVDNKRSVSFTDFSLETYNWNKNQTATASGKISHVDTFAGKCTVFISNSYKHKVEDMLQK